MGVNKAIAIEIEEAVGTDFGTPDYYEANTALDQLVRGDVHHIIRLQNKEPMTALAWATEARIIPLVIRLARAYGEAVGYDEGWKDASSFNKPFTFTFGEVIDIIRNNTCFDSRDLGYCDHHNGKCTDLHQQIEQLEQQRDAKPFN
jgi:hypothetical protein